MKIGKDNHNNEMIDGLVNLILFHDDDNIDYDNKDDISKLCLPFELKYLWLISQKHNIWGHIRRLTFDTCCSVFSILSLLV